jgi:hypothetical protein
VEGVIDSTALAPGVSAKCLRSVKQILGLVEGGLGPLVIVGSRASQFWRLEVCDQGVSMVRFWLTYGHLSIVSSHDRE